ncbi:N-acetylmuramoyl-L-alanine amidase [Alteripontixanthobacter maritimus]|uniref:N-acetylmuramoyl-L-alanine amidase n=1 Tax=Alteripontixanthobacter maritimus TaxID=2161824 RepID=A0A369Q9K7_9SPHN|nr:cell wall hydrolase [Alteripontixanthobacter maritimus]RDC61162.1 N-acetylmuramoyl-L-alanine amidase [Alteripontixanthobacter maritimus]
MYKKRFASAAVISATLVFTFINAEGSGAFAQVAETAPVTAEMNRTVSNVSVTEELVPVATPETKPAPEADAAPEFVSNEVVQTVPTTDADDVAANQALADAATTPTASSLRQLVSNIKAPASLSREMECLAGAVYFEARGEPIAGQLAVATVVINRSEARAFPASYCGVVYQRAQFSFVKNGKMPRIKRSTQAWKKAKKIARIAHEELWDSAAKDALYFHAKYVSPSWARKKQARATIKTHIFYR